MKKNGILILIIAVLAMSCQKETKQDQTIIFEAIAPQMLIDGSVQLKATASSGLPVRFVSDNLEIATIEGDRAVFHSAGRVKIYAAQAGNNYFYEAPSISFFLLIRDWDPNKKTQTIDFELPEEWKVSRDGQMIEPSAVASSGLPVTYTVTGARIGRFIIATTFYLYHAGESDCEFQDKYTTTITFTAAQSGNEEYNPADNVSKDIKIIGDVIH